MSGSVYDLLPAYFLPDWCAASRYVELMKSQGLLDVRSADWSEFVAPFWPAVLRR